MKQKRFILGENELPRQWYNIQAEMVNKPLPMLNPATREPLSADDLAHIFAAECARQELDQSHAWIDIPDEVLEKYKYYRSIPESLKVRLQNASKIANELDIEMEKLKNEMDNLPDDEERMEVDYNEWHNTI